VALVQQTETSTKVTVNLKHSRGHDKYMEHLTRTGNAFLLVHSPSTTLDDTPSQTQQNAVIAVAQVCTCVTFHA
jgi:hypothetical protein